MAKFFMSKFFIGLGFLLLLAGVVAGALIWHAQNQDTETWSWRYKITVNIETPEGIRSGSAVREVVNRDNTINGKALPEAGARISSVKGEAVVIDLEERGVVFGLIERGSYGELYSAFGVKNASNTTEDLGKLQNGKTALLPEESWPAFVTFRNISDPKSVKLVRGWKFNSETQKQYPVRHFEEIFGDGFSVSNIAIEITTESVTWGLVDRYLSEEFWSKFKAWGKSLNIIERAKYMPSRLFQFKQGETK